MCIRDSWYAAQVKYNNVATGMAATDVQGAITELHGGVGEAKQAAESSVLNALVAFVDIKSETNSEVACGTIVFAGIHPQQIGPVSSHLAMWMAIEAGKAYTIRVVPVNREGAWASNFYISSPNFSGRINTETGLAFDGNVATLTFTARGSCQKNEALRIIYT